MEQFNIILHTVPDTRLLDRQTYISEATQALKRQVLRMHARHFVSWLLRAVIVLYLIYLGHYVIGGVIGGAVTWTAGFLLIGLFFYISKGHRAAQCFREAQMYWLLDEVEHREFGEEQLTGKSEERESSEKLLPEQDRSNSDHWIQGHALS